MTLDLLGSVLLLQGGLAVLIAGGLVAGRTILLRPPRTLRALLRIASVASTASAVFLLGLMVGVVVERDRTAGQLTPAEVEEVAWIVAAILVIATVADVLTLLASRLLRRRERRRDEDRQAREVHTFSGTYPPSPHEPGVIVASTAGRRRGISVDPARYRTEDVPGGGVRITPKDDAGALDLSLAARLLLLALAAVLLLVAFAYVLQGDPVGATVAAVLAVGFTGGWALLFRRAERDLRDQR